MTVMVTGATGTLGRQVLAALENAGIPAAGLSRRAPHRVADLSTGQGVREALQGVSIVVHCATNFLDVVGTDLGGLQRILATAPKVRVVYPTIVGADRIAYPYYEGKRDVEHFLSSGNHVIVPLTQFHEFPIQLAQLPRVVLPAGFRTQPIAAAEAAQALVAALDAPAGRTKSVGGPQVFALRELVERVQGVLGAKSPIEEIDGPWSDGFRRGWTLAPEGKVGKQTWDAFFGQWRAAGMPAVRG